MEEFFESEEKMKSFAELKRNAKNFTWEQTYNSWFKGSVPSKLAGLKRKVIKTQTNAVQFEGGSWLYWPPAKSLKIQHIGTDGTVRLVFDMENTSKFEQVMKYELVPLTESET